MPTLVKFSNSLRECVEKQVVKNRTTIEIHGFLTEMTDNNVPSLDVYTILTMLKQVFFLLKTITILIKVQTKDKM